MQNLVALDENYIRTEIILHFDTTAYIEPENGEADLLQAATLVAPKVPNVTHVEKTEIRNNATGERVAVKEKPHTGNTDPKEYPEGWSLFIIVVALVLSIFLINFDMVCHTRPPQVQYTPEPDKIVQDNCCNGHPEDQ